MLLMYWPLPENIGYQHVQGEGRKEKKEPKGKPIIIPFRQIEAKQEVFQENTKEGKFL